MNQAFPSANALSGLLYGILCFGPLAFGAVEPWSRAVLESLILLLGLLTCLRPSRSLDAPASISLTKALIIVLGFGVLQWLLPSGSLGPRPWGLWSGDGASLVRDIILWGAYLTLFWSVSRNLGDEDITRLPRVVFGLGVVVACVGIAQRSQDAFAIYGLRAVGPHRYPFGPYANYNHAAAMMVMSIFMGGGLFLHRMRRHSLTRRPQFDPDFLAIQALIFSLILVLVFAVFSSRSRGGIVSLTLSTWILALVGTFWIQGLRTRWLARLGLAASLGAFLVLVAARPEWVGFRAGVLDLSATYRLSMYRSALRMFLDFPLFGIGVGGFRHLYPAYQEPWVKGIVEHVHGDWLELLLQMGLAGCAILLAGVAAFLRSTLSRRNFELKGDGGGLYIGALGALCAFFIHGFVEFNLHVPANAVLFVTLLAWAGALPLRRSPRSASPGPTARKLHQRLHLALACIVWCTLSLILARPAIASWFAYRAEGAPLSRRAYLLTSAIRWDPSPAYNYRLGAHYLNLAEEAAPFDRRILLREALAAADVALLAEPLNCQYLYLNGAILWRMGRVQDARRLLAQSESLKFW